MSNSKASDNQLSGTTKQRTKSGRIRAAMVARRDRPQTNPTIAALQEKKNAVFAQKRGDRVAWFEANEPPSVYGPDKFCSRGHASTHREQLEIQRFTVEYLKRQPIWYPRRDTTWREYAVEAAAASVEEGLRNLKRLAFEGEAKSVETVAGFALSTADTLASLTESQFESVHPFAQRQRHWPALKSLHQHFDSDHDATLLRLEVGKANPINIYKGKWNPTDDVGRIALRIWDRIENLRRMPILFGYKYPSRAETGARELPEFGPDTWKEWFEWAKSFVEGEYITQQEIIDLNKFVKAPTRKIPSYELKSSQKISSHFYTMLKGKFQSMAGCNRE